MPVYTETDIQLAVPIIIRSSILFWQLLNEGRRGVGAWGRLGLSWMATACTSTVILSRLTAMLT